MIRTRRLRLGLTAVLSALVWCAVASAPGASGLTLADDGGARLDRPTLGAALPSGLQLPTAAGARHLVSLVAADIDRDGDLDVVAADSSLELFVWTNDGSGHLVRVEPRESRGWQSGPESPSVEGRRRVAFVTIQNDEIPLHVDWREQSVRPDGHQLAARVEYPAPRVDISDSQPPRAPPFATPVV